MKTTNLLGATLLAIVLSGCAAFGPNPSAPNKFEETLFNVQTNYVNQVVTKTNHVEVEVPQLAFTTNIQNQIVIQTNYVPKIVDEEVLLTNRVEKYQLTPNSNAQATAAAAGTIGNVIVPGSGGLIVGIVGALFAAYGRLRSYKATGTVLAQNIATIRQVLQSIPDGAKYDQVIVQYLKDHQNEEGVLEQVTDIVTNLVNNQEAKGAATEIKNAIAALK